jgi:hypothetical protein
MCISRHECLPPFLKYNYADLDEFPGDELSFSIRGRVLGIQASLYYPFLYIAIHSPPTLYYSTNESSSSTSAQGSVHELSQKAIHISLHIMRGFSIRHRHHGLWFSARQCIAAGLIILATVKSGRLPIPDNLQWRAVMETAIADLRWWEKESPDLGRGASVLEEVLNDLRD